MTTPAPAPVDAGNQPLAATPAQIGCGLVDTPAGQRLAVTLTVLLDAATAKEWSAQVAAAAGTMSASGLVVAR